MFGYRIPTTVKQAKEFDKFAGNTRWMDSNKLEHDQLQEYNTFIDKGVFSKTKIPRGYKEISVHAIFSVKHDGRFKTRVVADGHLTDIPIDSVYAGVVSLRGFRMCLFLAELNGMTAYATDIGNAYLEAYTSEKVCIRATEMFGEQEGNLLIISKALYGLTTLFLRICAFQV